MSERQPTFFIDIKPTSLNPNKALPLVISYAQVMDYTSHAVPCVHSFVVEHDADIMDAIRPDVVAYNGFAGFDLKNTSTPYAIREKLLAVLGDQIVMSFESEECLTRMMNEIDCDLMESCTFIDLTYIIRKHAKVPTSQWSPKGYDAPPGSDPLFTETCFYGLVPESKWRCLLPEKINHRVQMGAMIAWELLQAHSTGDMVTELQLRDRED